MGDFKKQSLIYDHRVEKIIQGLEEGKERGEIAGELGYKSYKGMDMYMRRRNFRWDRVQNTYIPKHATHKKQKIERSSNPGRVAQTISLFQSHIDPKEVAVKVGFEDHNELASFMKDHGYIWSGEEENYVLETKEAYQEKLQYKDTQESVKEREEKTGKKRDSGKKKELMKKKIEEIDKYIPVIDLLYKNQENLTALLDKESSKEQLPRFLLKGDAKNKNIYMNRLLTNLLEEFSSENRIPQRDVVEGALIEYFRHYGYERIEDLLNN